MIQSGGQVAGTLGILRELVEVGHLSVGEANSGLQAMKPPLLPLKQAFEKVGRTWQPLLLCRK